MDHVRIDEGIKRGKRIRPLPPPRRASVTPACNSKLKDLDVTTVIQRYLEDHTTAQIAQDLGVHRSGLHQWLLRNCEEEWREAQIARALSLNEEAKDALASARDALSLARAREQLRSAQWELERLFSRLYGPKQEVTVEDKREAWPELLARLHREHMAKLAASQPTGVQVQQLIEHDPIMPVDKPDTA